MTSSAKYWRFLGNCALFVWLVCAACDAKTPAKTRLITVRLPPGPTAEVSAIRAEPGGYLRSARADTTGNLTLEIAATDLTLRLPEMCPLALPASLPDGATLQAIALIDLGPDRAQIGYDTPFTLTAIPGCAEAERAELTWQQTAGPALASQIHGFTLEARTLARAEFLPDPLPRGIVAVSPRTQGKYVFEAQARLPDGATIRRSITITSIARATGLSSLAVSQRVMLGGSGWEVTRAPRGSTARVEEHAGVATFAPDVAGKFTLRDGSGFLLDLPALTHDRTPMDCGRAECHAAESAHALSTPMSHALELPFAHAGAVVRTPGCMLDCHVTGERGLRDGGYLDVAGSLGFRPIFPASFAELPHALQRLGGVRCTSCHGPGAIPSPAGRSRILRASVCATCHDAPPAYRHVEAWSRSAMARADASAHARNTPACASCHTTGGFLNSLGVRVRPDASHDEDDAVVGISCAACHAPHAAHTAGALLRVQALPASIGVSAAEASSTGLCAQCHAPRSDELMPSASSAVLALGRVQLPVRLGGALLTGAATHSEVRGGCVGCHGHAANAGNALDHSFQVEEQTCSACHSAGMLGRAAEQTRALQARARAVRAAVQARCGEPAIETANAPANETAEPLHAHADVHATSGRSCTAEDTRARYLAALVAEDGAAAAHNAPYAATLLDAAEAALGTQVPARAP